MSGSRDLDLTFLHEIADGSNEFLVESIEMFLSQTPAMLAEIGQAIASADWATTGSVAHKLKPNLGFFGMAESQANMQEIEHMGKSGMPDPGVISAKFNSVKDIIMGNMTELQRVKDEAAANL